MKKTSNSRLFVTLVTGILYLSFILLQLAKNAYDWSVFITAGDQFADSTLTPQNLFVARDSTGYDGQFYYRLALTPFTNKVSDYGISLDHPPFRQQRIMYPIMARLLSTGRVDLVPVSLVLLNFLGLLFIAWAGAFYAQKNGSSAIWGFAFALYPGFLLTFSRDTVEIIAACFLLGAIICFSFLKEFLGALLLSVAVLTKETCLILAIGILLSALINKGRNHWRWVFPIIPIAVYFAWQLWLAFNWKTLHGSGVPLSGTLSVLGPPFLGIGQFLLALFPPNGHSASIWVTELALIAMFSLVTWKVFSQSKVAKFIKISMILYALLAVTLTRAVWVEDWAFLRVLYELYFLGIFIIMNSPLRYKTLVLTLSIASWFSLALEVIYYR